MEKTTKLIILILIVVILAVLVYAIFKPSQGTLGSPSLNNKNTTINCYSDSGCRSTGPFCRNNSICRIEEICVSPGTIKSYCMPSQVCNPCSSGTLCRGGVCQVCGDKICKVDGDKEYIITEDRTSDVASFGKNYSVRINSMDYDNLILSINDVASTNLSQESIYRSASGLTLMIYKINFYGNIFSNDIASNSVVIRTEIEDCSSCQADCGVCGNLSENYTS